MQPKEFMEEDREQRMLGIKQQIERGDYRVDAAAVADAILNRILLFDPARSGSGPSAAQKECSYPASGPSESTKTTPPGPCSTEPIQVTPNVPPSMLSIVRGGGSSAGGTQKQSS
jgi:hypothetical protein